MKKFAVLGVLLVMILAQGCGNYNSQTEKALEPEINIQKTVKSETDTKEAIKSRTNTENRKETNTESIISISNEVTSVKVLHHIGGENEEWEIKGTNIDDLRDWISSLEYKHKNFKKGKSPGDFNGNEGYIFNIIGGDIPGFSYLMNGDNKIIWN